MAPTGGLHGYLVLSIASRLERYVDTNNLCKTCAAEPCFKLSSDPDTHPQVIGKPLAWLESGRA